MKPEISRLTPHAADPKHPEEMGEGTYQHSSKFCSKIDTNMAPQWVPNRSWRSLGGSRNLSRRRFASWIPLGALLDTSGAEKN